MLLQADMFQILADVIGMILTFLKPIVSPIGAWMVEWIEVALQYFPSDSALRPGNGQQSLPGAGPYPPSDHNGYLYPEL